MSSFDGRKKFATYKEFHIADATENYKLSFNESSYFGDAGESLSHNNGMEFSTFDNDHDESSIGNCAAYFGANWWGNCGSNSINGKYGGNGDSGGEFMFWTGFWNNDKVKSLKSMTLMFRQAD